MQRTSSMAASPPAVPSAPPPASSASLRRCRSSSRCSRCRSMSSSSSSRARLRRRSADRLLRNGGKRRAALHKWYCIIRHVLLLLARALALPLGGTLAAEGRKKQLHVEHDDARRLAGKILSIPTDKCDELALQRWCGSLQKLALPTPVPLATRAENRDRCQQRGPYQPSAQALTCPAAACAATAPSLLRRRSFPGPRGWLPPGRPPPPFCAPSPWRLTGRAPCSSYKRQISAEVSSWLPGHAPSSREKRQSQSGQSDCQRGACTIAHAVRCNFRLQQGGDEFETRECTRKSDGQRRTTANAASR